MAVVVPSMLGVPGMRVLAAMSSLRVMSLMRSIAMRYLRIVIVGRRIVRAVGVSVAVLSGGHFQGPPM